MSKDLEVHCKCSEKVHVHPYNVHQYIESMRQRRVASHIVVKPGVDSRVTI